MYVSYFSLISFPIGLHTYSKTCINNMQIDANLPTPLVRPSALICVSPISWTPFGLTIVEQPILLVLLFWHQRLRLVQRLRPLRKVGFTWGHIRITFRKGGTFSFFLWLFKLWKHQLLWFTLRNSYHVSFAFRHLSAAWLFFSSFRVSWNFAREKLLTKMHSTTLTRQLFQEYCLQKVGYNMWGRGSKALSSLQN